MSEIDKEVIDDQTIDEDKTEENENADGQQDNEPKDNRLKSALIQKEIERTKRLKAEEELERLKKSNVPTQEKQQPKKDDSVMEEIEKLKFTQRHPDIDVSLVDDIYDFAKAKGSSLEDAVENPIIKSHLEKMKEQKNLDGAIPSGNRSPIAIDKDKKEYGDLYNKAAVSGRTEDWAAVVAKRLNKI